MFTVNGTKKELSGVFSVKEYLEQNGYVISQIAVELNEEILPKTEYVSTVLKDGDVMEIVSFTFSVVILVFAFAIQLLNLLPAVIDVILTCEKRLFCLALHRSSTSLTTCCFSFPMLFLRSSPLIRTGVHISRILL